MKLRQSLITTLLVLACGVSTPVRADLYWDSNGNGGPGDGGSDTDIATGTWGTDDFWGGATGAEATGPWTADETAVFSAAADVTGTYTVTVSGTQDASGIRVEEGTVTLTGGTIDLANAGTVTVATGLTTTINSAITGSVGLKKGGTDTNTLILGGASGANTYTGNTRVLDNPTALTFNTLRLGAAGVIPDTSVLEIEGRNSIFDLNGNNETVKSVASINTGAGALAGSRIEIGAATLTINDSLGDVFTYSGLTNISAMGKLIKNGAGHFTLGSSNAGFHGELVLNSGLFSVVNNNSLGTTGSGTARITLNGGTILNPGAAKSIQSQNVDIGGSFSVSLGASDFQFIGTGNPINAEFPFAGDEGSAVITLKASPTIHVSNSTGTGTFILTGAVGDEGQNRGITKDGPGVLTLRSKFNSFTGDITILAGQVRFDADATLGGGGGSGANTIHLAGGGLSTNFHRNPATVPVTNPINMTADATISTTRTIDDVVEVDYNTTNFTNTAGTLTFRNDAGLLVPLPATNLDNQFEPRFSGAGLNISRPIVIAVGPFDGIAGQIRTTRFSSANASGTQTYSGVISGPGKFRRMVANGTTLLTGANTYTGGTDVEGGTLSISGATATAGGGDITVTGGTLSIAAGVANAIADTAALSISGTGIVNLGAGINDAIAALSLGGAAQTMGGTYGSTASGATFQNNTFFSGLGVVNLVLAVVEDADFDDDADIDGNDFLIWQRGVGAVGTGTNATGDANDDTNVDGLDLAIWKSEFGTATVAAGAIPEPASLTLMALSAAAVMMRGAIVRRRVK